ncbi:uncharacterized protein LOC124160190 [Ischnura elegans]|uniref:uncharacterized protein LOC124160190 n=1 Tax=Ischnura elegans TaxID=197161 RepID=UPI001ED88C79|nr:uncharacterized protein LOC124160190 [Ischnura elegans]
MGLIVDIPRPGSGNTNDGNTARRFFNSPKLAASLTGVNEDLINRFSIILKTLSSGLPLNDVAFSQYCLRTAELYVELYPWYYMPTTVHKVLMDGSDISKKLILPLGELSEEALEARNKDARRFRERFTRKHSRVATNEDLFKRLFLTSDPLLSSFTHASVNKKRRMPKEVKELLIVDEIDNELFDSTSDEHSSED